MTFTDEVWQANCALLDRIQAHPFVTGLGDGSLPREAFQHYMQQDALYLADYARTMGFLAARAVDPDEVQFWAVGIQGAIVAERGLHANHVTLGQGSLSPNARAYTDYLVATAATAPYEVGVAAVLPCFWIYQHVGTGLLAGAGDLAEHAYGDWIGMYADEAFAASTRQAIQITDRLAEQASADVRDRMAEAFGIAARYEWMFWDAAWRMEQWPV